MYVIVGLGNPDEKYQNTRHNVGFDVIDYLAQQHRINIAMKRYEALCGMGMIESQKVLLVKPLTYMNQSGQAVRFIYDFYRLDPAKQIIVISDDVYLQPGCIRIREKGSAGGHNGLKSIISHLGTEDFIRIRVGVGQTDGDLIQHVLGKFSQKERPLIEQAIVHATDAVDMIVMDGIAKAMNRYNGLK